LLGLSLHIIDSVQTKVQQHFLNVKNRPSKSYDFLCGDALDVKWVHLIFKNSQLHARKICMRAAIVRSVLCANARTMCIQVANARRRCFTGSR
jgi:hypothetical protein